MSGSPDPGLLRQVRAGVLDDETPSDLYGFAAALHRAERPLGAAGVLAALGPVGAALAGAGPLQPLLDHPGVTDVLVNGPGEVWVDRGDGLVRGPVLLTEEGELRCLAVRLAALSGRRLDDASPFVDARLPGGVRLHAVLPPLSPQGTLLSLRIPAQRTFTMTDLVAGGTVPACWVPVLNRMVRGRLSFLVSGGTGSGKTTILSTLLGLADPGERVLLVEDAAELRPDLPHVVRLEARHGNVEGAGEVTLRDLVRHALRMRPDRVVVGECRGGEVQDLLHALNTGHEGGCGTVHANSAQDVAARLEALGSLAGLNSAAVAVQAESALDAVLHLHRGPAGRRLAEIGVVCGDDGRLRVRPALSLDGGERCLGPSPDPATVPCCARPGPGWASLRERLGR